MTVSLKFQECIQRARARLEKIRAAPQAVSGGVAIGMFWSFTPLTGVKTAMAVLCAWISRCSKVSAALAVTAHDVLTPIWPLFLRWEYDLGYWLLSHPHRFPERLSTRDLHLKDWLQWKTLVEVWPTIIWPTMIGSMVFAVPAAIGSYFIVAYLLRHHKHGLHLRSPAVD